MTQRDSEQSSLTDYSGDISAAKAGSESGEQPAPSPSDSTGEFLEWLQTEETPSPAASTVHLPELIEVVKSGGYSAWKAADCIDLILDAAEPPVHCPDLIIILGNPHVDNKIVIEHLLQLYPLEKPVLAYKPDFEAIDELPLGERMDAYRVLSRLPPDDAVYNKLKKVVDVLGTTPTVGSVEYEVGSYFTTYSMRCLDAVLKYPEQAPRQLALKTIKTEKWNSLRRIAADPKKAAAANLLEPLANTINGVRPPIDFPPGSVVRSLCEGYIRFEEVQIRQQMGDLIQVVVEAGVEPTDWESTIPALMTEIEVGETQRLTGSLLAVLLSSVYELGTGGEEIAQVCSATEVVEGIASRPAVWSLPAKAIAEAHRHSLLDHLEELVSVIQRCDGKERSDLCEVVATVGKEDVGKVRPAIEPLVQSLPRVQTVEAVNDIGLLLRELEIYPPPPQLRELYGSSDAAIDHAAKGITADLRRQFRESSSSFAFDKVTSLREFANQCTIVRRTGAITWEKVKLGETLSQAEKKLVLETAQLLLTVAEEDGSTGEATLSKIRELTGQDAVLESDGQAPSVQFVTPSHDSEWVVLTVLGAMIALIVNPDLRVAFHTPATNGWGTKKDLRESLERYGISPPGDSCTDIVPVLDIVPTARVADGNLTVEDSSTTLEDNPPHIAVVRDIRTLSDIPADVVLYNFLPGIVASDGAQLHQWRGPHQDSQHTQSATQDSNETIEQPSAIADRSTLSNLISIDNSRTELQDFPDSIHPLHIELHGIFSTQFAADRRQHVGPPTDLPNPMLLAEEPPKRVPPNETSETQVGSRGYAATHLTTGVSEVDLYSISSEKKIGERLEKIDQACKKIDNADAVRALRSMRYTLSGLPVPVELHDTWIQNQLDKGNSWVPRRLRDRQNQIRELEHEASLSAERIHDTRITIDTLLDELETQNPLFEKLLSVLDNAAAEGVRVGILCSKKTYKDMLDGYLKERAGDWVLGDDLHLLDEDTVRGISPQDVDWLITFDTLPPQTAIYYHHPAIDKTVVLGHAAGDITSRLSGIDRFRRPYLPPRSNLDLPSLETTTHGITHKSESAPSNLTDDLYRSYLSAASQSRDDDESNGYRSGGDISKYQLVFNDDTKDTLWDAHPVIVKSDDHLVSEGEFVLRSLSRVSRGDELVYIDRDTRANLWEQFLRQNWDATNEEANVEAAFMDAVQLWMNAVLAGLEAHSNTDDLADGIPGFASEIAPLVSVDRDTILGWARSVYRADSPSDLVFRKELRTGPQQGDGVEAVAGLYGDKRMAENWEQVFIRIKSIRTALRQRGSSFWEWLVDRACDGTLFSEPGVVLLTVSRCRKE